MSIHCSPSYTKISSRSAQQKATKLASLYPEATRSTIALVAGRTSVSTDVPKVVLHSISQVQEFDRKLFEIEQELIAENAKLEQEERKVSSIESEFTAASARCTELETMSREQIKQGDVYTELEDAFGVRGTQSFIIESALQELELASQKYEGKTRKSKEQSAESSHPQQTFGCPSILFVAVVVCSGTCLAAFFSYPLSYQLQPLCCCVCVVVVVGFPPSSVSSFVRFLSLFWFRYLDRISAGSLAFELSPWSSLKRSDTGVEKIEKVVRVRSEGGNFLRRTVRQLSGGQRHRIALSFSLGFLELVERRRG